MSPQGNLHRGGYVGAQRACDLVGPVPEWDTLLSHKITLTEQEQDTQETNPDTLRLMLTRSDGPVLMVLQKPETSNQTNDLL